MDPTSSGGLSAPERHTGSLPIKSASHRWRDGLRPLLTASLHARVQALQAWRGQHPATPTGADRPRGLLELGGRSCCESCSPPGRTGPPATPLTRALDRVTTDESREKLRRAIAAAPDVDPLDALRDATELVSLLAGWRWQTVHAARRAGATWDEIADATRTTVEQARADYAAAIDRQQRIDVDVAAYRARSCERAAELTSHQSRRRLRRRAGHGPRPWPPAPLRRAGAQAGLHDGPPDCAE